MTTAASGTTQWAKNRYGQRILIDPTDFIGQKVLRNTIYDLETLHLLEDLFGRLKPEVILDIGANISNHTLMFSRFAHKVLSFEPGARAFSMLSQNLQANGLNHVQPFQIGLSDSDTVQTLYVETSGNLGGSSLVRTNMDTQNHEEDIITLKIGDAVLHEQPPGAIDFIKIDVEGHEHAVIRGLRHTISRHRPVILMEWEQDKGWLLEEHARPSIPKRVPFLPAHLEHQYRLLETATHGLGAQKLAARNRNQTTGSMPAGHQPDIFTSQRHPAGSQRKRSPGRFAGFSVNHAA